MKILLWFGLIAMIVVLWLIACTPPSPPLSHGNAKVLEYPESAHLPMRLCDENGICCYVMYTSESISCVATRIIVIVSPGEIKDETQRSPAYGGEVSNRALEERLPIGSLQLLDSSIYGRGH